jgi:hypothetical protein
MKATLFATTSLIFFGSIAAAQQFEANVGGYSAGSDDTSFYGSLTYSLNGASEDGLYVRLTGVQSNYNYDFGGEVDGTNRQAAAIVGYQAVMGSVSFKAGVGYVTEQVTETGGLADVDDSYDGVYAEGVLSLSSPDYRSMALVEYREPRSTVYVQADLLYGLSDNIYVGAVGSVFDQDEFRDVRFGLKAEFDLGAGDNTILSVTATTGERTVGSDPTEDSTAFSLNIYQRF